MIVTILAFIFVAIGVFNLAGALCFMVSDASGSGYKGRLRVLLKYGADKSIIVVGAALAIAGESMHSDELKLAGAVIFGCGVILILLVMAAPRASWRHVK